MIGVCIKCFPGVTLYPSLVINITDIYDFTENGRNILKKTFTMSNLDKAVLILQRKKIVNILVKKIYFRNFEMNEEEEAYSLIKMNKKTINEQTTSYPVKFVIFRPLNLIWNCQKDFQ